MTIQMEFPPDFAHMDVSDNLKLAIKALRAGGMILLLDSPDRENEGDLIIAAEKITASSMNFLIKHGSGVVCLALPKTQLDHLGLPLMASDNTNFFNTAFTVSIEARGGVTTGVSAKDRAHTILVAMADDAQSSHLARPGHVFPLAAKANGVFDRMGHTEGSVDLMRIAGLKPGAVLCELMNEDGSMTVGDDRYRFAKDFNIPVVTIEEILCHRMKTESMVTRSDKKVMSKQGPLFWHSFDFGDQGSVDIFCKEEKPKKPLRLASSSAHNLAKRLLEQILTASDDDPLAHAFLKLAEDDVDMVIFVSDGEPKASSALKTHATICRALQDLGIKDLSPLGLSADFIQRASHYFSIKII